MKAWLKSFFEGMFIACKLLFMVAIPCTILAMLFEFGLWLETQPPPSLTTIVIVGCTFFVIIFGLIWSSWN